MISIVTISLQHGSYPPLSGRVDLKKVVGRQVLGQSRFTQPWGRRGKTIVSLRAGRHGTPTECVCKMGEPGGFLCTFWLTEPSGLSFLPCWPSTPWVLSPLHYTGMLYLCLIPVRPTVLLLQSLSPLETCLLPWKAKADIKHSPLLTDRTVKVGHTKRVEDQVSNEEP